GFMRVSALENFVQTGHLYVNSGNWGILGRGGRRYIWHEFGQDIFVLPFYLFTRRTAYGFFLVNAIATALTCILIIKILLGRGFSLKGSTLASFSYGLGTIAWHYGSKTPHEHAPAILFTVSALYFAIKYTESFRLRHLVLSALSIGFGFITKMDVLVSLLPLGLFFYLKRDALRKGGVRLPKAAVIFFALLIPFACVMLYYNYYRFGNIFQTGYGSIFADQASKGAGFSLKYVPMGLAGILASPGKSIFLFSPVLLLFPLSIKKFRKKAGRDFFLVLCAYIVVYTLFYCSYFGWSGDWCYGPRFFMLPALFMTMATAALFDSWQAIARNKKMLVITIVSASIFMQIASVGANAWLGNCLHFGISDDNWPNAPLRNFGEVGTWKYTSSYFVPQYSQLYNQLRLFSISINTMLDRDFPERLADGLALEHPAPKSEDYLLLVVLLNYYPLYATLDVWWLQYPGAPAYGTALIIGLVGVVSIVAIMRKWRKPDEGQYAATVPGAVEENDK
ncbi:MAG: glycosyltransferase family 39 protein, partial [Nitrospiraceae bacterium]|nr:glycosyltransferase family 39 protein [Nitrospiraceae bacterium]